MFRKKTGDYFKPKIYNNKLNQTPSNIKNHEYLQKSADDISPENKTKTSLIKLIKAKNDYYTNKASQRPNKTFQFSKEVHKNSNTITINATTSNKIKNLNYKKINNIETEVSKKQKKSCYTALYSLPKNTDNSEHETYNGLNKINCSNESNRVNENLKKLKIKNLKYEFNKIYNKKKKSFKDLIHDKKKNLGVDLKKRDVTLIKDKMKEEVSSNRNKVRKTQLNYKKTPEKKISICKNIIKIIDEQKICVLSRLNYNTIKTSRNLDNQCSKTINGNDVIVLNKKIEDKLNKNYPVNLSYRGLDLMKKIEHSVDKKYKANKTTLDKPNKYKKFVFQKKK